MNIHLSSEPNRFFEIQGHRGSRGTKSENTLEGFAEAIIAGVAAIELDALITQDGAAVIQHNFFVNRDVCQYKNGSPILEEVDKLPLISSLTLKQVKQLDCGSKLNRHFPEQISTPGAEIPTLPELFEMIQSMSHPNAKQVKINLEIKYETDQPTWTPPREDVAKAFVDVVKQSQMVDRIYYSSFDRGVLEEVHKLDPSSVKAYICYDIELDEIAKLGKSCLGMGANVISPNHSKLTADLVQSLNSVGLRVIPWTVNTNEERVKLQEMGVAGIITDYPLKLIEAAKK